MKKLKDEFGQDICPHCGAPLLTRTDYRTHLTLKSCQQNPGIGHERPDPPGFDGADLRQPPKPEKA